MLGKIPRRMLSMITSFDTAAAPEAAAVIFNKLPGVLNKHLQERILRF
jgi:hypothetical protein